MLSPTLKNEECGVIGVGGGGDHLKELVNDLSLLAGVRLVHLQVVRL